ncbi:hypothetical protein BgiMline_021760, partial [Biomphalaria glabrata]
MSLLASRDERRSPISDPHRVSHCLLLLNALPPSPLPLDQSLLCQGGSGVVPGLRPTSNLSFHDIC